MGVAMGVHPYDGIDQFCQHGHVAWCPFLGVGSTSAPAWMGSPSGTSVTGHAQRADRLLIRPTGGPGRCRQPRRTNQDQGTPTRPDPNTDHTQLPTPSLEHSHPGARRVDRSGRVSAADYWAQTASRARRVHRGSVGTPRRRSPRPNGGPTGAGGCRFTRSPCYRTMVAGVTIRCSRPAWDSNQASAANTARSAQDRRGLTWRHNTATSCRRNRSSAFFDRDLRASSPSQATRCRTTRYSSRQCHGRRSCPTTLPSDAAGQRHG
jgi:hypothetical protein